MTAEQARHIANLVQLINVAQQKGALSLGEAKVAIIAIDALAPELDRLLNVQQAAQAPQEAQAS
jgi:uncharacterized protein (DUF2252 family)